jgi:hypothetical protein
VPLSHVPVDALDRMIEVSSSACVKVMQMIPESRDQRAPDSDHTYNDLAALSAFLTKAANDAKKRRVARG